MPDVEYGSLDAANEARDQWPDHLCSNDDRRLMTVTFAGTTPDDVLDQARRAAEDSRSEGEGGAGQVPLTDHEQEEIDFSKGRANVPHARSIKGIARSEGVDDWTAHYDPTLTVDEHREVMQRAATEGGGRQQEDQETATEKAGRASRTAQSEQCDHARGHCKQGEPDACEFLKSQCSLSDSEVQSLLSDFDETTSNTTSNDQQGNQQDDQQIEGKAAGALSRSWDGYQQGVRLLVEAIDQMEEAWTNAQQAAKAINSIRDAHGQEPIHFENLESGQADLLDFARQMAADCHECHADHGDHDHNVTEYDVENIAEAVVDGASETPVGTSDETDQAAEQVIEMDDQQTLGGGRADDQARLAGGEQGEQGQGETEQHVEENPGGLLADERDETTSNSSTEQQIPDEFQVAEGGQETL
jgi:hypothetical protein